MDEGKRKVLSWVGWRQLTATQGSLWLALVSLNLLTVHPGVTLQQRNPWGHMCCLVSIRGPGSLWWLVERGRFPAVVFVVSARFWQHAGVCSLALTPGTSLQVARRTGLDSGGMEQRCVGCHGG